MLSMPVPTEETPEDRKDRIKRDLGYAADQITSEHPEVRRIRADTLARLEKAASASITAGNDTFGDAAAESTIRSSRGNAAREEENAALNIFD